MIDRHAFTAAREAAGLSQPQLARLAKCSQQLISAIELGTTLSTKFLPRIANVLNVPPGQIDPEFADLTPVNGVVPGRALTSPDSNFPVHASAMGGPGEILVTSDPVDFTPRPAPLIHVRDAYGIIVTGDSMAPEYRSGDTALVNPHLPPEGGKVFVFYAEKAGEARATIKELRRATDTKWRVFQHNPQKEFELSRGEWRWAHRVVGKYEGR